MSCSPKIQSHRASHHWGNSLRDFYNQSLTIELFDYLHQSHQGQKIYLKHPLNKVVKTPFYRFTNSPWRTESDRTTAEIVVNSIFDFNLLEKSKNTPTDWLEENSFELVKEIKSNDFWHRVYEKK